MVFLLLLPLLGFTALLLVCYGGLHGINGSRIRPAFLQAVLLTCLYIVIITEALSPFKSINITSVFVVWLVYMIVPVAILFMRPSYFFRGRKIAHTFLQAARSSPSLWIVILFVTVSALLALLYPTNNHDSLTYHMARVGHWINNQSISHYQTHIIRQLVYPPFAEWIILHLQILSGTDRFANLVQTMFFGGCIVQISLITKILGGERKIQIMGALFTALIPMAIIQSNTTQNDIVVSYFVLAFVYYTIRLLKSFSWYDLAFAGISLGLSWLTKGTAYLFTMFFCCWYLVMILLLYRLPVKMVIGRCAAFAIIPLLALTMNSGHYYRNSFLTGSFLGNASGGVANEGTDLKSIGLVSIKNLMNHLPVTSKMKLDLVRVANRLGVDIDDPAYNFNPLNAMMEGMSYHEDYAQNFIHVLLIVISIAAFFFSPNLYRQRLNVYRFYVITCIITGLAFSVLFKWQPWSNRLETALFMLFCPLLAFTIGRLPGIVRFAVTAVVLYYSLQALTKKHQASHTAAGRKCFHQTLRVVYLLQRFCRMQEVYRHDERTFFWTVHRRRHA